MLMLRLLSSRSELGVEGEWLGGQLTGLAKRDTEYGGWQLAHYK